MPGSAIHDLPLDAPGRAERGVPLWLDTPAGRVLTWWHAPVAPRGITVVIAPGMGLELSRDYRVMRRWAAELARYGHGALRLSWPGTGFNAGTLDGDDAMAGLESVVSAAIAWRCGVNPAESIVLAGRRGGALVAASQLDAPAVVGAIWWTPALRGRQYVRELQAYGRLQRQSDARTLPDTFDGVEIGGYRLPRALAGAFGPLDLVTRAAAAPRPTLLISAPGFEPTLEEHQALASAATVRTVRDAEAGIPMDDWTQPVQPVAAVQASLEFLRTLVPATAALPVSAAEDREIAVITPPGGVAVIADTAEVPRPRVVLPASTFDLAAMHVPPSTTPSGVGVLLLGNGTDPFAGAHDLNARLARRFADAGHHVWSVTLPGIGDSLAPAGAREQDDYPAFGIDAIRDVVGWVRAQAPVRALAMGGICSGGWYALHAAAAGVPVDLVLAGNPPLYFDGSPARRDEQESLGHDGVQLEAADGRVHPWRALLVGAQRGIAVRYLRRLLRIARLPGGPMHHPWRRTLDVLTHGAVPVTLVYGRHDVGFRPLVWAGALPADAETHQLGAITVHVTDGTDHQFSGPAETLLVARWESALSTLAARGHE